MNLLHITPDEASAIAVRRILEKGAVVAWDDTFCEGPLFARWKEAPKARAKFFANNGLGEEKRWLREIKEQQEITQSLAGKAERILVWFGATFREQLQLSSLVSWSREQRKAPPIAIVPFPQGRTTGALSGFSPTIIRALAQSASDMTMMQTEYLLSFWRVLTSNDPRELQDFDHSDNKLIPAVNTFLNRWLQEFPSRRNGLSRNQKTILEIIGSGSRRIQEIYQTFLVREPGVINNYLLFLLQIKRMAESTNPAIYVKQDYQLLPRLPALDSLDRLEFGITSLGWDLLKNKADWVQENGIDRWLGGVHLRDDNIWRWDANRAELVRTYV